MTWLDDVHRQMLAETMRCCRELPEHERQRKRETDTERQQAIQEWCYQQPVDSPGETRREAS